MGNTVFPAESQFQSW